MKKMIILKHGGGELANQLWNYMSIYAFGIESGTRVENPSFFEYHSYFNFIKQESILTKFFSFWFEGFPCRRSGLRSRFFRVVYSVRIAIIKIIKRNSIISSENTQSKVTYLPPTSSLHSLTNKKVIYFIGWLFRNPVGIKKFRKEILLAFAPNKTIEIKVSAIINPIREKYEKVIGIHIRQADYKVFKGGKYLINQQRVREIIDEYIKEKNIDVAKTMFLITSDGSIDENFFKTLHIYISKENAVTDLFLLSSTDAIIGSDSSFGSFASWYGNIPHIILKKEPLDWDYYRGKATHFKNKYSAFDNY